MTGTGVRRMASQTRWVSAGPSDRIMADEARHFLHVGAADEGFFAGAGQDDDAQAIDGGDALDRLRQFALAGVAQRVALAGLLTVTVATNRSSMVGFDHLRRRSTASLISGMRSLPKYMSSPPTKIVGEPKLPRSIASWVLVRSVSLTGC